MPTPSQHPEHVPAPRKDARPRQHDTFAVLERAQAAVDRAEWTLDIARETVCQTGMVRRRRASLRVLDESTHIALQTLLG
jgi:hypothetical protein